MLYERVKSLTLERSFLLTDCSDNRLHFLTDYLFGSDLEKDEEEEEVVSLPGQEDKVEKRKHEQEEDQRGSSGDGNSGLRTGITSQGTSLVSNALVGLAAVTGFLFIVFFILIIKRLFFKKDDRDDEEFDPEVCAAYENKAFEVEMPHADETRTTNL
ncbi:hypothetical protein Baya_15684 [Bagarius yarrelli]|uniref:Uncharacterized protein n=1 Tax=Bagarius yarrelli TaxID=175774 RepID=A0A556VCI8_BAGYA|nr:hypothetical protein Baya_15684 [Bagarius yarrelli]